MLFLHSLRSLVDLTRVRLSVAPGHSDYINASHVKVGKEIKLCLLVIFFNSACNWKPTT